jgi:hypothetical protein
MLRGPRDVGNGLDRHAIVVSVKGRAQNRQLLMRPQSSEALVGLGPAGRDPSQGHTGIPPALKLVYRWRGATVSQRVAGLKVPVRSTSAPECRLTA